MAQAAAPKVAAVGLVAIAKWVAAGSVLAAGVLTVAQHMRPSVVASPPAVAAPAPARIAAPSPAPVAAPASIDNTLPSVTAQAPVAEIPLPSPAAAPRHPRASPNGAGPTLLAAAPSSPMATAGAAPVSPSEAAEERRSLRALGEQVASIDRARGALAAGNPAEALRIVDEYDAKFPEGMLSQEATILRVEALVKEGDRPAAVAVGQRFLAAHATSPHAARVKQLLGDHNP
jgi:hypothetical protein